MGWNYRVMAIEHKGCAYLQIHEVYYNNKNIPDSYTATPISIGGEDLDTLKDVVGKLSECLTKPILWYGDKFPNEYIIS